MSAEVPTGGPPLPALAAVKAAAPRFRNPALVRQRLLDAVSRGAEGPLTVVSAGAGMGKTYLLASWTESGLAPGPVAWLRLDEGDDEPGVFWAYVVEALRSRGVELPDDVGLPMRADGVDGAFLARLAGALASRSEPVVLVLDEFEVARSSAVARGLDRVLRDAASGLRLVLLTRGDVALPLHHWRLTGALVEIGGAELAFSPEEAVGLLRQHGVRLDAGGLRALLDHTKGWAAGLRLSALAMQRMTDPSPFLDRLPNEATLASYLVDEVLGAQSQEVREFLLRTSVADRLTPSLANALSGRVDSDIVLGALVTGNVLTEALEQAPAWYRYHPLFAHVLRTEFRRERPDEVLELHRRAATWFEQAGMVAESVRHSAQVGDWQPACQTVVRALAVGDLLAGRLTTHLAGLFSSLPATEPGAHPAIVRAALALARFDADRCREELHRADALILDDGEVDAARASVAVMRAVLARSAGDVVAAEQARDDAERHLARLPDVSSVRPDLHALLLSSVGSAQLWAGRFEAAERTLREGLVLTRQPGCEYPRLNMLGRSALLEFRHGHLRRAAELGHTALQLAERTGLPVRYRTGAGHLTLAMVALEWNDRGAARQHLDNVAKTAGARHDPLVATLLPVLRAWQHASVGDFSRAHAALADVPTHVAGTPLPTWLAGRVALATAAVHLRQGDVAGASACLVAAPEQDAALTVLRAALALATGDRTTMTALLSEVLEQAEPIEASVAEAWLLMAKADWESGERGEARQSLDRALSSARPEGYRRIFVEAGPWVRAMLQEWPDLAEQHRWLGAPLVTGPAAPPAGSAADPPAGLLEPLTERERTVLAHMAEAKSTDDIAAELYLSVNTVKTHQKNIHRKLSVARRNDAVRRGRQLGLI